MRKRPERIVGDVARRLGLLGLIATVLVALLGVLAPAASASPTFHPQTRVAAIEQPTGQVVGPHDSVLADQGRPRAPNYDRTATGSSVAAEDGTAAQGGVYTLRDPESGEVLRTGRTIDLAERAAQHASDAVLGDLEFQIEYRTDVYAEQRGLEQMLHDQYPGAQAANGGYNLIRGISPSNPNLDFYMRAVEQYLAQGGG